MPAAPGGALGEHSPTGNGRCARSRRLHADSRARLPLQADHAGGAFRPRRRHRRQRQTGGRGDAKDIAHQRGRRKQTWRGQHRGHPLRRQSAQGRLCAVLWRTGRRCIEPAHLQKPTLQSQRPCTDLVCDQAGLRAQRFAELAGQDRGRVGGLRQAKARRPVGRHGGHRHCLAYRRRVDRPQLGHQGSVRPLQGHFAVDAGFDQRAHRSADRRHFDRCAPAHRGQDTHHGVDGG